MVRSQLNCTKFIGLVKNYDKALRINRMLSYLILAKAILTLNHDGQLAEANCNEL